MPNRSTHVAAGAVVGLGAALALSARVPDQYQAATAIGAVLGGVIGGAMPDMLEPATSPQHRAVMHGAVAGGAITFAAIAKARAKCASVAADCHARAALLPVGSDERKQEEMRAMLWFALMGLSVGFAAGYGSHLLLDSFTPDSIPLVARGF